LKSVTVPLQTPAHPRGASALAKQFDFKHGSAGSTGLQRLARGGADHPTRVRRAGNRLRFQSEQEQGHAGLLGGKGQPPAGGKVERWTLPMAFDDQCRKAGTARGIGGGLEQSLGIGRDAQDQGARIAAQLDQAWPMEPPSKPFGFVCTKPEDRETPANRS
jgi:hypothetical protein